MSIKWEVSIIELKDNGSQYKVTKRIPDLGISDTKLFSKIEKALEQFREWTEYFH